MKHKFTVEESSWSRGGRRPTRLLNIEGNRCCLGFAAEACGLSDDEIYDKPSPETLGELVVGKDWFSSLTTKQAVSVVNDPLDLIRVDTKLCGLIVGVNDDPALSDEERKAELKKLFAKLDVEVEFVE